MRKTVRVKDWPSIKAVFPSLFQRFSDSGSILSQSLFTSVSKVTLSMTSSFNFYQVLPTAWSPVVLLNTSFLYLFCHENTSSPLHTSATWDFKLYSMEFRIILGFYYNHIYKNQLFFLNVNITPKHLWIYIFILTCQVFLKCSHPKPPIKKSKIIYASTI